MPAFNAINRGVYIADNIYFLQSLNDECIDLVCIDPPFAKNETFGRKNERDRDPLKPPLTDAERANEFRLLANWGIQNKADAEKAGIDWPETAYKDIWAWGKDVHESWLLELQEKYEHIAALIEVTRHTHSDSTAAYLCYMAIRLIEIHRILKPTGSLFLHCDHTANGYLRQLLDAIFGNGEGGKKGFRNEIIWCYTGPTSAKRWFARKHDTIYWYSKSASWEFNGEAITVPYKMIGIGKGDIIFKDGDNPKRVAELLERGKIPTDWWADDHLSNISAWKRERAGYPTQKPVALAERIIKASTNPGDVVLDCFAGCAYVAVAAERLQRQWVACDIQPRAWTVFKRQFNKPNLALLTCADAAAPGQQVTPDNPIVTIHGPNQLPTRTSPETETPPPVFRLPERTFKVPASIIPEPQMLEELLKLSNYQAWCCGFANRRPDGRIIPTTRNFHLDHIAPKSKQNTGTSNDIQNRAPMCPYHNLRKNNRRVALAEYRQEIAHAGELMVDTINDLINLDWAQAQAMQIYGQAYARQNPMGL